MSVVFVTNLDTHMSRFKAKRIHFCDDGGVRIMELDLYLTTRSEKIFSL